MVIGLYVLIFLSVLFVVYNLKRMLPANDIKTIEFENIELNSEFCFMYADATRDEYLMKLRDDYDLDRLTENLNDIEKTKTILYWTHHQWKHSGSNEPSKADALTILKEAKEGYNFRCVEYGIVLSSALNSIGIISRVLHLKTADCETVSFGAGHVASEAYLEEFKKWVFIDGQFNAIPTLKNVPLNAVEFQKAIIESPLDLLIVNKNGKFSDKDKQKYIKWIGKYLFYFTVSFDNRVGEKLKVEGKDKLMLVPLNSKNPHIFQKKYKIDNCLYTNSKNDFYKKPN